MIELVFGSPVRRAGQRGVIYAMAQELPTPHVHGEVTAILLIPLPLPFPPRVLHASHRVGGGRIGRGNEQKT